MKSPTVFTTALATALLAQGVSSINLIDTHVHNADLALFGNDFYTFQASFPDLNKTWTMADFADATSSLPYDGGEAVVGGVILMELEKQNNDYESGLAEAAFYQSVANRCNADPSTCGGSKVVGLVASAPLEMGHDATIEYLTTLQAAAPNLVGIRQGLWVKDASFFYDEGFRGGLSALPAFNLPFDILVEHDQLSYTIDLATALPTVMFNLNHLGYPTITNATNWASWLDGINKLAALPNVYIKLSGLPQTYDAPGWTADDFTPYVKAALDAFGAQRMNYAGNWFVLMDEEWEGNYPDMVNAVMTVMNNLEVTDADREWIFAKCATELYHL